MPSPEFAHPAVMQAVYRHTTGTPDMTLMDEIIFVADYIEPNRKMIRDMEQIRVEAFSDLDKCVIHILKNTLDYLSDTVDDMDYMTQMTYNYYVTNQGE